LAECSYKLKENRLSGVQVP